MTDQCKNCKAIGDIKWCLMVECDQHNGWFAKQQIERVVKLETALKHIQKTYTPNGNLNRVIDEALSTT